MVELADTLHGWTKSVYSFGCAFIHLSSFHDHQVRDPLDQISVEERDAILAHLRYYQDGPPGPSQRFADVVPLMPRVFEKIADNLECYIKDLESDGETAS
jgi:hypothetical protein